MFANACKKIPSIRETGYGITQTGNTFRRCQGSSNAVWFTRRLKINIRYGSIQPGETKGGGAQP